MIENREVAVDFGLIPSPTSVGSLFGRRFEGYKLNAPPSLLNILICNIFSHNNKSELFLLYSEIRLNWPNSVNNFLVCFFLFISFIISLCLFNIICRVALLGFCFSGKITRFSQQCKMVATTTVEATRQKDICLNVM